MKQLLLVIFVACLIACSSTDSAFVLEVKRFQPQWVTLSEKVAFLNRNTNTALRRYEQDLKEIEASQSEARVSTETELYVLQSEYQTVISERDSIHSRLIEQRTGFNEASQRFNTWQSRLVKGELQQDQARADFDAFRKEYETLHTNINQLQNEIISNIESHNAIVARLAEELNVYNNYNIVIQ